MIEYILWIAIHKPSHMDDRIADLRPCMSDCWMIITRSGPGDMTASAWISISGISDNIISNRWE